MSLLQVVAVSPVGVREVMMPGARHRVAGRATTPAGAGAGAAAPPAEPLRLAGLVTRMATGDEAALATFYDATVARAYGLALRVTGSAALAEEVVVDAFHQAWREAARYDAGRGGPLTWLLMICRSRALDALRARDPAVPHADPETLVADDDQPRSSDPLDLLAALEAKHALHAALAVLSAAQRQMLALAFFRGFSHQEIAAQAHVPLGTVKSQIRRALATLRDALATASGA